jgi:hypothetical protein
MFWLAGFEIFEACPGCAQTYLIDLVAFFILLLNECVGGRGSMPCVEEGKSCFHSIRNLSAYHVWDSVLFIIAFCLSCIGGDETLI